MAIDLDTGGAAGLEDAQRSADMIHALHVIPLANPGLRGGVNNVKKKPAFVIGNVVVRRMGGENSWMLRFRDPLSGQDVRRRIKGLDLGEIKEMAAHHARESFSEDGLLPGRKKRGPGIKEALAETLRLARMNARSKEDMTTRSAYFVKWLEKNHPAVKTWDQLRPAMLQGYIREMEDKGLAHDTIRLRTTTIRSAWRFAAENFPDAVHPLPKSVKQAPRPLRFLECLEPVEIDALLTWLWENAPGLAAMGTLQSLCGLRVCEAAFLRRSDIDLEAGTLAVCDTGAHKPKNQASHRTIPLPADAVSALLRLAALGQKVQLPSGELFLTRAGRLWNIEALSHRWLFALREAAVELKTPRLAEIPPKRLRSSFATMASRLGCSRDLIQKYMGHTSGTVLEGHYLKVGLADLRAVSDRMNAWRSLVSGGAVWQESGNTAERAAATS